jgi:hypothetical protein
MISYKKTYNLRKDYFAVEVNVKPRGTSTERRVINAVILLFLPVRFAWLVL